MSNLVPFRFRVPICFELIRPHLAPAQSCLSLRVCLFWLSHTLNLSNLRAVYLSALSYLRVVHSFSLSDMSLSKLSFRTVSPSELSHFLNTFSLSEMSLSLSFSGVLPFKTVSPVCLSDLFHPECLAL